MPAFKKAGDSHWRSSPANSDDKAAYNSLAHWFDVITESMRKTFNSRVTWQYVTTLTCPCDWTYQVVTIFSRAALLLIHQVAPFILSQPLRLK